MINIVTDITARKVAEDKVKFLMSEVSHRSKNLLTVIQAIARQTARSSTSIADFSEGFSRRLSGIAASYELLIRGDWSGASLQELIEKQLAPFTQTVRLSLHGPPLLLSPEAAQSLGMALHELATNATKYSALSVPNGRIGITWRLVTCSDDQRVIIRWIEKGGTNRRAANSQGIRQRSDRSNDHERDPRQSRGRLSTKRAGLDRRISSRPPCPTRRLIGRRAVAAISDA